MPNDFIAMEHAQCPVCGVIHTYNTGILIHQKLKPFPKDPEKLVTHIALCQKHSEDIEKGYIICIVASDESKPNESRTGELINIKKYVFEDLFTIDLPSDGFCYITEEIFTMLKQLMK